MKKLFVLMAMQLIFTTNTMDKKQIVNLPPEIFGEIFIQLAHMPSFKKSIQAITRLGSTTKQIQAQLDNENTKKKIFEIFEKKLENSEISTMFQTLTNQEIANQELWNFTTKFDLLTYEKKDEDKTELLYKYKFIVNVFKKKGANLDRTPNHCTSFLYWVASYKPYHENFIEALLANGANPNMGKKRSSNLCDDDCNETPLMIARIMGNQTLFKLLLKYDANVFVTNVDGSTVFHECYAPYNTHSLTIDTMKKIIQEVKPEILTTVQEIVQVKKPSIFASWWAALVTLCENR